MTDLPKLSDAMKLLYPRVVCLITTVDAKGAINAAPADWVMPVDYNPPLVSMIIDESHDTWKNIAETKEFVINVLPASLEKQMLVCAKGWPHGVNELEKAKLKWTNASKVKPPLVTACPSQLECRLHEVIEKYDMIIGEVVAAHAQGKKFKPLIHLGDYTFSTVATKRR
jgi:flavin reductase (DIM6/NTAB) family NADH-FMN oxidoreductase RutF